MAKHCDEYIDDPSAPACLRAFLAFQRQPAIKKGAGVGPSLFAKHNGLLVRVVMASRFGDVGISNELDQPYGYFARVMLSELSDFSEAMSASQ